MKIENLINVRNLYTMTLCRLYIVLHVEDKNNYTYCGAATLDGARDLLNRKRAAQGGDNWFIVSPFGEVVEG